MKVALIFVALVAPALGRPYDEPQQRFVRQTQPDAQRPRPAQPQQAPQTKKQDPSLVAIPAEFFRPRPAPTQFEDRSDSYGSPSNSYAPRGRVGPVYTFVKTDPEANFKWGVRHVAGAQYGRK